MLEALKRDIQVNTERPLSCSMLVAALLWSRGSQAMLLLRTAQASYRRGLPVLPEVLQRLVQLLYHVDVSYRAHIGPGLTLRHCHGVVVGAEATLGCDVTLFQNVTIGKRLSGGPDRPDGMARVGDRVTIGAGAVLLGPITVGAGATIGANAVVIADVPERATVTAARSVVRRSRPLVTGAPGHR